MTQKILIIDDNEQFCESLSTLLSGKHFQVLTSLDSKRAFLLLKGNPVDIILLDVRLEQECGTDVLTELRIKYPSIPVIMLTGFGTIRSAVDAIKQGAFDYIQKPVKFSNLLEIIKNALNKNSEEITEDLSSIISQNLQTLEILKTVNKLAPTNIPILLLGQNGTGKEMFADYIQSKSRRKDEKFIKINCASFTDSLLDNELFGHDKGAYTGADTIYKGVFEKADCGTLFLDEIGDMPINVQSKVLRVLQNKELFRLGGDQLIKVDIRIIAATNKDLEKLIRENRFRQDLYYRLNAAIISIPPLNERRDDIPFLSQYFLKQFALENNKNVKELSADVLNTLHNHDWKGNIRELKNLLSYAVAVSKGVKIEIEDLPMSFNLPNKEADGETLLEQSEKSILFSELKRCNFNKKKVAENLNMSRSTLYSKLKKYELSI